MTADRSCGSLAALLEQGPETWEPVSGLWLKDWTPLREGRMAIEDRLETLEDRRRALDELIRSEFSHPGADDLHLVTLKRQKLALRDEIESIRRAG